MRVKNELDEDEQGKLFVGGLSWETTQENLQRYFSRYGEVIDCVVMKNSESGRSRGFGFVTFADPANVTLVLQNGPHQLDGRTIDPKPCNPRTLQKPKRSSSYPKVFLGGLPSNVTETDLRTYFMRFGKVMEVVIMYDQEKKKSRGFGFLSFEDEESVERCVSEHFVNLSGKQVEIKKAEPRDSSKMNDNSGANQWGPPQNASHMAMGGGMGMGTPSGQMGGPMGGMGPMGPGNMMSGYQGWGSTPQTQGYPGQWGPSNQPPMNGYGTPSGPGGYQNWGAPPGPQGQQMAPPQWGSNYPPQQTGYGSYGDMYSGGATGAAPAGPTPPAAPQKTANDYAGYGGYTGYQQDSSSYGGGRSYAGPESAQGSGGGYSKQYDCLKEPWPSS
uniref:RRM domain-containing protein n=2 Tax=Cicadellinae TaxID=33370 RepID=A0A1B6HMU0_9HEMI